MKINVIGAGPAGLYFALIVKRQHPSFEISIFEKGPENTVNGLGYTLQGSAVNDLFHIDPNLEQHLGDKTSGVWNVAQLAAKGRVQLNGFSVSTGIKRNDLLTYLRNLAQERGVNIFYDSRIESLDVIRLKKESDLIVAADGINSVVRNMYSPDFGTSFIEGTNSYIWFANKNCSNMISMNFLGGKDYVFLATSYPIDRNTESFIVEGSENALKKSGLRNEIDEQGKMSERGLEMIAEVLYSPLKELNLESHNSRWARSRVNDCQRFYTENVALIGESAISTHYSYGVGLGMAFEAAKQLSASLYQKEYLDKSLDFYNQGILKVARKIQPLSLSSMRWLENMDEYYSTLGYKELISSFSNRELIFR